MNITIVPRHYVEECWDRVVPLIEKSFEYGGDRYTIEHVKQGIYSNMFQLWVIFEGEDDIKAALITRVITYPLKKILTGTFIGGEEVVTNAKMILDALEAWGRQVGCNGMEMGGRMGWKKVLEKQGFSNPIVAMERSF